MHQTSQRFFTAPKIIASIIVLIILVAGTIFWFGQKNSTKFSETSIVKRGDISQEVAVTGKTTAAESVSLSFEKAGKVAGVFYKVGDLVKVGQVLVTLEAGDLQAQEAEAEANLQALKAKLAELERGTRPEELAVSRAKVSSASAAMTDAAKNLLDKRNDSYTRADDAVRAKVDPLYSNPRTANPFLKATGDPQLKSDLEQERKIIEQILVNWKSELDSDPEGEKIDATSASSNQNLSAVQKFLDKMALFTNGLQPTSTYPQTTIDLWKSDVSEARSSVNAAISNLSAAIEKKRKADSDLQVAQAELALAEAGATPEEILAQAAAVKEAEARLAFARAEIRKTRLFSPINGIVTLQDAKPGQIVPANSKIVSVIAEGNLEIEANVPEIEIGKIALQNPVAITLDAFPGEIFAGEVTHLDPAETIVDEVVNFKIEVNFTTPDPRFKSGLTADLAIKTGERKNVLVLPQLAIRENEQGAFVEKIEMGSIKRTPVRVGLRGSTGMLEILEGLAEGDRVQNGGFKTSK